MSEEFMRILVQGFRGSEYDSQVFELTIDFDLPMTSRKLKNEVTKLVNKSIDKRAEEIIIYLTTMKRLKPK